MLMLDEKLQDLVNRGVPAQDIIFGAIKNLMYEVDLQLSPLQEASNTIGSDENYEDTVTRLELTGYMDALIDIQNLVIDLTYALEDKNV